MTEDTAVGRRGFLKAAGILGVVALTGLDGLEGRALAWTRPGPDDPAPELPNEIVKKIFAERFGDRPIQKGHVVLDMATMQEDGRYVPVVIESDLPMSSDQYVKAVYVIVDHNPDPLVTAFHFSPRIGPIQIQTRIKMKRTSWIRAIAETSSNELWADYVNVETTLNGCG